MKFSVEEISKLVNGVVEGDANLLICRPSQIESGSNDSISFISNPKYLSHAYSTKVGAIVVNHDLKFDASVEATLIRVTNAYESFSKILGLFSFESSHKTGIEGNAFIHPSCEIGKDVYIGHGVYIEKGAKIGDNVKIYPNSYIGEQVVIEANTIINANVNVYHQCFVGKNCILHSGVVIGADGFGFANTKTGAYNKVPQTGNVIIEDDVEIGANTCIDRATISSTIIKKGVKLDNLIQVGHNVIIGEHTVIAALTGISGSTKIGANCVIAGQVGFVGHIEIADGTVIGAQSGISRDTKPKDTLSGTPAFEHKNNLRSQAIFRKLPDMVDRLKKLELEIDALKAN